MNKSAIKDNILKNIKNYNSDAYPSHSLYAEISGNDMVVMKNSIEELKNEGLIIDDRKFLSLTEEGDRVSGIGYSINANHLKDKRFKKEQDVELKEQLELKALKFNDTWRFIIIVGFVISIASFILSILPYFKK